MIQRKIQSEIEKKLFRGKIIILTGARQVGKTTLIKNIANQFENNSIYLNCDEADVRIQLTEATSTILKNIVGGKKLILIDEAQRVKNIGLTLKLFADELPEKQVIATGSSALELSNEVNEPLTGRKYEFQLYPFSFSELKENFGYLDVNRLLEERIIFGMYPEIVLKSDEKKSLLKNLASSYLFKDILNYQGIRKPEILEKLLTALALQIGSQVSYNELSNMLKINKDTITKYIDLLEKAYVIFRLPPFSRNLRSELSKMRKIYFYDTGIRNALISNFNLLEIRQDTGALWENFLISERIKNNSLNDSDIRTYFWRTQQQQEIDFIEEYDERIFAYEFKWNPNSRKIIPKTFANNYPSAKTQIIDKENFNDFLSG